MIKKSPRRTFPDRVPEFHYKIEEDRIRPWWGKIIHQTYFAGIEIAGKKTGGRLMI
jgi:hypothetical protein